MKKIMALVLVLAMALAMMAGCSSNQKPAVTGYAATGNTEAANAPAAEGLPLAGKKFAYILNGVSSDIFQMAANAAKETAEALVLPWTCTSPTPTTPSSRTPCLPAPIRATTACS